MEPPKIEPPKKWSNLKNGTKNNQTYVENRTTSKIEPPKKLNYGWIYQVVQFFSGSIF